MNMLLSTGKCTSSTLVEISEKMEKYDRLAKRRVGNTDLSVKTGKDYQYIRINA